MTGILGCQDGKPKLISYFLLMLVYFVMTSNVNSLPTNNKTDYNVLSPQPSGDDGIKSSFEAKCRKLADRINFKEPIVKSMEFPYDIPFENIKPRLSIIDEDYVTNVPEYENLIHFQLNTPSGREGISSSVWKATIWFATHTGGHEEREFMYNLLNGDAVARVEFCDKTRPSSNCTYFCLAQEQEMRPTTTSPEVPAVTNGNTFWIVFGGINFGILVIAVTIFFLRFWFRDIFRQFRACLSPSIHSNGKPIGLESVAAASPDQVGSEQVQRESESEP